jgi:glycosyltransferase involved in cell wall biosynthesis
VQILVNSLVVGGAERVVEALCQDLPAHGVDVALGCLRDAGPIGRSLADAGLTVDEQLAPHRRRPAQVLALRRFLRSRRPHVVYFLEHSNALLYGRVAARLAGVRSQVVAVHRTGRADGQPSLGRVDHLLMPLTDRVVAVSRRHAEYLREEEGVAAAKLIVIHNGVDPARFARLEGDERARRRAELSLPPDGPVVAVVAALRPEKNHRLLLEALVRLPAEERPHLAIVGDGPEAPRLRHAVAELALDPFVHWLGRRDDVNRVLACVDVLGLCSHPRVETFPLCVLEAMATGLPVVATRVGSLDEMVEDGETGRLVRPGSPDEFATALQEVLQNTSRARTWGDQGRQRVQRHFTREGMVAGTAELLWELARRHGV